MSTTVTIVVINKTKQSTLLRPITMETTPLVGDIFHYGSGLAGLNTYECPVTARTFDHAGRFTIEVEADVPYDEFEAIADAADAELLINS